MNRVFAASKNVARQGRHVQSVRKETQPYLGIPSDIFPRVPESSARNCPLSFSSLLRPLNKKNTDAFVQVGQSE